MYEYSLQFCGQWCCLSKHMSFIDEASLQTVGVWSDLCVSNHVVKPEQVVSEANLVSVRLLHGWREYVNEPQEMEKKSSIYPRAGEQVRSLEGQLKATSL